MKLSAHFIIAGMFLVVASVANLASAQSWTLTTAPLGPWRTLTASADGMKLVAAGHGTDGMGDPILPSPWWMYTSVDGGLTWSQSSAPSQPWTTVASSADGTHLVAASTIIGVWEIDSQDWGSAFGTIFRSEDSGVTWTQASAPTNSWAAIASSADGMKLAAVAGNPWHYSFVPREGSIWVSADSGKTWRTPDAPVANWSALATSADGTRLVAVSIEAAAIDFTSEGLGSIYTSADSGTNWVRATAPTNQWIAVASSADGARLVAASLWTDGGDGLIYQSTNSGATWTPTTAPADEWACLASSADGLKLIASDFFGIVYNSNDAGVTWTNTSGNLITGKYNPAVSTSADGCRLAVAAYFDGIYTSQPPAPALSPRLKIRPAAAKLTLTWLVPSSSFGLQENSDLSTTNWTDVPATPTLNYTNLHYEVNVSPSPGSHFYRLKQH